MNTYKEYIILNIGDKYVTPLSEMNDKELPNWKDCMDKEQYAQKLLSYFPDKQDYAFQFKPVLHKNRKPYYYLPTYTPEEQVFFDNHTQFFTIEEIADHYKRLLNGRHINIVTLVETTITTKTTKHVVTR